MCITISNKTRAFIFQYRNSTVHAHTGRYDWSAETKYITEMYIYTSVTAYINTNPKQ